ncbi:similar to Saccharomyces cerevisiae YGR015C Putative protein of unknown function [Maudiozyma saulgeensis]|uniref:AB hydrolase-1 domain-containing protein n=1 Tax=Maudiozyma saulgeensis TaxID=1789683 RepID=A0A1X7RA16_9SACH|nr:similar to Saccharomyces cerevisiae YGR015C Putative protein of unknown function [Kazachstania saulgeensis]
MSKKLPTKEVVDLFFTHIKPQLPGPDRPILINIHGFLGSKITFHSLNRSISPHLNTDIFTMDIRCHGDSPQAHPMTYPAFTKDMLRFIDTQVPKNRPIDFVGYSMGGRIAMMLALNKSLKNRVRKVVAIDVPPYTTPTLPVELNNNWKLINDIVSGQLRIKRGGIQWRNKIIDLLGIYFGSGFLQKECNYISKNNKLIEYYLPVQEFPNVVEDMKKWEIMEDMNSNNDTVELLVQRGLKSCMVESDYNLIGKVFPNFQVEEFNTSHNLIFEEYDKCVDSIINFLKK